MLSLWNKRILGLDIGTDSIKIAEMYADRESPVLANAVVIPTPKRAVQGDVVIDPRSVGTAVRQGVSRAGIKTKQVVASVSGQGVVVRQVVFPLLEGPELDSAVYWEAHGTLPFPVEEAILDYQVLNTNGSEAPDQKVRVLLAAARENVVEAQVRALQLAGLHLRAVDVKSLALARCFWAAANWAEYAGETAVALVDIGAASTDIIIVEGEAVRFTRTVNIGGHRFNEAISSDLGIDVESSERIKTSISATDSSSASERGSSSAGSPESGRGGFEVEEPESTRNLIAVAADDWIPEAEPHDAAGSQPSHSFTNGTVYRAAIDELVLEIRRSLDYFRLQYQWQRNVSSIVLAGGSARLPGLSDLLQSRFGTPVRILDPLSGVRLDPRFNQGTGRGIVKLGPLLGVAIGLCLREVLE